MTEEKRSESVDALIGFLDEFEADRSRGESHALAHYLRRFPGHEESIAREYLRTVDLARKEHERIVGSELFAGRYRLDRVLGKGGQGEVWLARDMTLGRSIALKLGGPSFGGSAERSRLAREARVAAAVEDPRICRILSVDVADGHSYIVMEFVAGKTMMEAFVARENPFGSSVPADIRRVAELFREIAIALGIAHARGIVHRDVKPNNLMLKPDGSPVILDFGLARAVEELDRVTLSGDVIGTPGYMSPEQIEGKTSRIGPHSDVFALGVVFCEALTLRHPFEAATDVERRARILRGDFIPLRRLAPWVPQPLATCVEAAIEHDPARRYPDAARFAADIAAFLEDRPISARPVSRLRRASMLVKRNRGRIARAAAVLAIGALSYAVFESSSQVDRERDLRQLDDLRARLTEVDRRFLELWPKDLSSVAAMEGWCDEVSRIRSELPRLRERREELRSSLALPVDREAERAKLAEITNEIDRCHSEIAQLDTRLVSFQKCLDADPRPFGPGARLVAERNRLLSRIAALERDAAAPRNWFRFSDEDVAQEHAAIVELIARIEALEWDGATESSLPAMTKRRDWTRTLADRLDGSDADLWIQTIEAIADESVSPRYRGFELRPQFGLVPLGRDPETGCFSFAHLPSGIPPAEAAKLNLRSSAPRLDCIVFVLIPGGEFEMGLSRESAEEIPDANWNEDEEPVRTVDLAPFFVAKHEFTQEQWIGFTGSDPSLWRFDVPLPPNDVLEYGRPVESVLYNDVRQVLNRFGLDLPTEAQWEYTARADAPDAWYPAALFGGRRGGSLLRNNLIDKVTLEVVRDQLRRVANSERDDGAALTAPVGGEAVNPFGIVGLAGNVSEMCRDAYVSYVFNPRADDGLRAMPSPQNQEIVIRGGNYLSDASLARITNRNHVSMRQASSENGFRAIRAVDR